MTQLFRSKSSVAARTAMFDAVPPSPTVYLSEDDYEEEEEEEEEEDDDECEDEDEDESCYMNPTSTPLIEEAERRQQQQQQSHHHQFPILAILIDALRKSLVTCTVGKEDLCSMDIGWPTEVRHVSHVTFDRFNGFLGLPVEFQPQLPRRVPSASASVFGVSAESMQCSYDHRGNSVPTILLMMQRRLYAGGGLQAEGIFRVNAENSQEESVRDQLNRGIVPHGIDVHCLAGLIKAWFRELPRGVLDSLSPEQVLHCNTEEECTQVVSLLPPVESALLDWAINLMADVVQHEHLNKMNARNIAMVFAPNMTQMADPLTALIHAVQVMNLLKTLITKVLREREESAAKSRLFSSHAESPSNIDEPDSYKAGHVASEASYEKPIIICVRDKTPSSRTRESNSESCEKVGVNEGGEFMTEHGAPISSAVEGLENKLRGGEGDRLSWRKGVRRLCRHPVFQLSKPGKKQGGGIGIVDNGGGSEEPWG
ncbi:hypothetical protein Syun_007424 [Stephania yunnanensis]|uniref:Rho-GAP domain-containing protein n=1 Tax=Stephania yunnanensis TaxID=152371 RepID=A0AAP0KYG7_9MAGN